MTPRKNPPLSAVPDPETDEPEPPDPDEGRTAVETRRRAAARSRWAELEEMKSRLRVFQSSNVYTFPVDGAYRMQDVSASERKAIEEPLLDAVDRLESIVSAMIEANDIDELELIEGRIATRREYLVTMQAELDLRRDYAENPDAWGGYEEDGTTEIVVDYAERVVRRLQAIIADAKMEIGMYEDKGAPKPNRARRRADASKKKPPRTRRTST